MAPLYFNYCRADHLADIKKNCIEGLNQSGIRFATIDCQNQLIIRTEHEQNRKTSRVAFQDDI